MSVESLFSVPAHWEVTTLGQACERGGGNIQTGPFGSQLHASDYVADGIPSIMPQNIGDNRIVTTEIARIALQDAERLSRYRVRVGDIVYSRRGDVERRALVREPEDGWLCGTGCLRLRVGTGGLDPGFTSFYLGHPEVRGWIVRHAIGATMPNLNTSILSALPIVIPPPEEQREIATLLGALDDKIELNRSTNETLESISQAIFKSWFVDFDPVRARAEGGKPSGIVAKFPAEFSASRIGLVPCGWEVGPITSRARLLSGGTPKTSRKDYWNGDILWCSAKDVSQAEGTVLLTTERMITEKGLRESATQLVPPWCTVVVARGATTGRMVLLGREMAMNQTCYALQSSIGTPLSLYCQLRVEIGKLVHAAHGSVFDTITTTTFANSLVILPPEPVLLAFENRVKPFFDRILSNTNESHILAALREILLPKLVSGQIGFNQAEKIIEANA